jgi:hypothetical protein
MMLFESYSSPCELSLIHSNIQYGLTSFGALGALSLVDTLNNMYTNPYFISPDSCDYSLGEGSLCINAGTPFYEINGDTLINLQDSLYIGPAPDMGAFESDVTNAIGYLIPVEFKLKQNYPNPFNPVTTLEYEIPKEVDVKIYVFDISGRKMQQWDFPSQSIGRYKIRWNGIDQNGKIVSSGVYLYTLQAGDFIETKKMVFMK